MEHPHRRGDASDGASPCDAIVIGSGIAGLGVAAMLARQGRRVRVLERHTVAGGLTHTFQRKGYAWDVGLHYLGKVHAPDAPLRRVFDHVTAGQLAWAPMAPVYDRLVFDDRRYDFVAGEGALESMLGEAFPAEAKRIATYLRTLRAVDRSADRYFIQHALPGWLTPLTHPLLGRPFRTHSDRTTHDALSALTADARLRGVLAGQWGNHGLPPAESSFAMHALVAAFYLDGGSYPVGGAGALLRHIAPVIARGGGEVRTGAEVEEILIRKGRAIGVRLTSGEELLARHVISGAGVPLTLGKLLPEPWRPTRALEALRTVRPSTGHACLYLGVRGSPRELALPATNLWIHAGYDHDANLRAFHAEPAARLPFVYVSSAAARDPDWERRHPGRATLTALCPVPSAWFERWAGTAWRKRGPEYEAFKAQLAERLLAVVLEHYPQLKGRVEHQELSTPLSTAHFSNHPGGAMYGLEHSPARFRLRALRPETPIQNLLLVGQDVVSVGVGASLMSAVLAASVVLRRNLLGHILKESP